VFVAPHVHSEHFQPFWKKKKNCQTPSQRHNYEPGQSLNKRSRIRRAICISLIALLVGAHTFVLKPLLDFPPFFSEIVRRPFGPSSATSWQQLQENMQLGTFLSRVNSSSSCSKYWLNTSTGAEVDGQSLFLTSMILKVRKNDCPSMLSNIDYHLLKQYQYKVL